MALGSGWWSLHLRRLHRHPARSLLTVATLALSAATVVVVTHVNASLPGSMEAVTDLSGTADLEVTARDGQGFDEGVLDDVAAARGVAAVVPLIRTPVRVDGVEALLLGTDARVRAVGGDLAARVESTVDSYEQRPGDLLAGVFVGARLADELAVGAGDAITVSAFGGDRSTEVLEVISTGPLATLDDGFFVLGLRTVAQELTGRPGRLDAVAVVAGPATDPSSLATAVEAAAGASAVVVSPAARAAVVRADFDPFRRLAVMTAGVVAAASVLVVLDLTSIALWRRRSAWALLRGLGGRRRALRFAALTEALALGLVGGVAGVLAGRALAGPIVATLPPLTVGSLRVHVSPYPSATGDVLGFLVGPVGAVAATIGPLRRVLREAPMAVLDGNMLPTQRVRTRHLLAAVGGSSVVAAGVLAATGRQASWTGAMIGALAFGGAGLVIWALQAELATLGSRVLRRMGPSGRVASMLVAHAPHRAWVTLVAVIVGAGTTLAIGGIAAGMQRAGDTMFESLSDSDVIVQAAPVGEGLENTALEPELVGRMAAAPEVGAMSQQRHRVISVGRHTIEVVGVGARTADPLLRLAPEAAQAAVLDGTATIVSSQLAISLDVTVGDGLLLGTRSDGPALPIAAVVNLETMQAGAAALSLERFASEFGPGPPDRVELVVAPGVDVPALETTLGALIADMGTSAFVTTGEDLRRRSTADVTRGATAFRVIATVVAVDSVLAIVAALLLQVVERAPEVGVLRALGASRRRLRRAILLEAAALAAVGAVAGVVVGGLLADAGARVLERTAGFAISARIEPMTVGVVVLLSVALASGAAIAAATRASYVEIGVTLREG